MGTQRKPKEFCISCGGYTKRRMYKYCSNLCQMNFQYATYIEKWKQGEVSGLTTTGIVNNPIKRFLRIKYQDQCCLCGWSKINVTTGVTPLVADHIDGNWRNNIEGNLRLICPNCDAISPTYAALNKGNGRRGRSVSKRTVEAREEYRKRNRIV